MGEIFVESSEKQEKKHLEIIQTYISLGIVILLQRQKNQTCAQVAYFEYHMSKK